MNWSSEAPRAVYVVADSESVVPKSARQRDLLALLLIHPNVTVSSDRLIDRLWQGEPLPRPWLRFRCMSPNCAG